MSRVSDILTKARDSLADANKLRWDDARLLRLLDEGQKELVLEAKMLRVKIEMPMIPERAIHIVPDIDCHEILRILIDGKAATFKSHEEMDRLADQGHIITTSDGGWEDYEATGVQYVIYDKINPREFKLYPIQEFATLDNSTLAAAAQVPSDPLFDTDYGIVTGVTGYDFNTLFGVVIDFDDDFFNNFQNVDTDEDGTHGVLVTFEDSSKDMFVYYLIRPTDITLISDTLDIDPIWDVTLKHFIVGMCLRDDKDTQNRTMGNEELSLFAAGVSTAKASSSKNFMATTTIYEAPYTTGLE